MIVMRRAASILRDKEKAVKSIEQFEIEIRHEGRSVKNLRRRLSAIGWVLLFCVAPLGCKG
jgi:hypothetical protein